jgi:parallel beta-helix repeat protein
MKDYYLLTLKTEVKSVLDIYYRVEGSALLLLLKEFTNIQTSGNPVTMIEIIAMLIIAIAKLDWILDIEPSPSHKFICTNRIYVIPSLLLDEGSFARLCYRSAGFGIMFSRNMTNSTARNNYVNNEEQCIFVSQSHDNEIYNNTVTNCGFT